MLLVACVAWAGTACSSFLKASHLQLLVDSCTSNCCSKHLVYAAVPLWCRNRM